MKVMSRNNFKENLEDFLREEANSKQKLENEAKIVENINKENYKLWKKEANDFEIQERKTITEQVEKEVEVYKSSEKVELKIRSEIESLRNEYENNKQACISYLVDKILDVELVIPDVVLGLFSAKFNN